MNPLPSLRPFVAALTLMLGAAVSAPALASPPRVHQEVVSHRASHREVSYSSYSSSYREVVSSSHSMTTIVVSPGWLPVWVGEVQWTRQEVRSGWVWLEEGWYGGVWIEAGWVPARSPSRGTRWVAGHFNARGNWVDGHFVRRVRR